MGRDFDIRDIEKAFAEACRRAGLVLMGPPILDGHFHRTPVDGSRSGQPSGAYRGYLDGVPAGYIKNHKTGEEVRWVYDQARKRLSPAALAAASARCAAMQAQRDAERQRCFKARARELAVEFDRLAPASALHPYLLRKGLDLRPSILALLREDTMGALVVPVRDLDGRLWSGQRIFDDGFKDYAPGGRIAGGMLDLGAPADTTLPFIVAEGFATGATLDAVALGHVLIAFQGNNLAAVAQALHARYPQRSIIIAGDDDRFTTDAKGRPVNPGKHYAEAAAATVGGYACIPFFSNAQSSGTDWNDLQREEGTAALLHQWNDVRYRLARWGRLGVFFGTPD